MNSVLRGLYNGDIIPWERRDPHSKKHLEIVRKIEEEERYFLAKLPPEDRGRFEALSGLHLEFSADEDGNLFSYAFTLGMLLTMDALKEAEGIFED